MQSNHATLILDELAKHYTKGKMARLADRLGLKPPTLAGWKDRDSLDYPRIYTHCKEISAHWLLTGDGPMLKSSLGAGVGQVSEAEISYSTPPADSKVAIEALQKVVAILERDNARMTRELEELRAAHKASLWEMESQLNELKKPVETH